MPRLGCGGRTGANQRGLPGRPEEPTPAYIVIGYHACRAALDCGVLARLLRASACACLRPASARGCRPARDARDARERASPRDPMATYFSRRFAFGTFPMELQQVIAQGETFVKNAEDTMSRPIINTDQLYVYDNQVEVIDTYLADTEDLQGQSPDLASMRARLRGIKEQLEKKIIEVEAKAEGIEGPPEDIPPAELAAAFEETAPDLLAEADKALKKNVTKVDKLHEWEEPLAAINSFLADSEPVASIGNLAKVRGQLKERKHALRGKIQNLVQEWRQADLAGGDDDEEEE
jgi:hypothetical protein